jgi:hypothetical protein
MVTPSSPGVNVQLSTCNVKENAASKNSLALCKRQLHRTFNPYFCVMGGTSPFMRRYSTIWP